MDGYLLETTTLSALINPKHPKHQGARAAIGAIDPGAPKYVSVIAIAELQFGQGLAETFSRKSLDSVSEVVSKALTYPLLDVTRHTALEYGQLKAALAKTYLQKALRRDRPRWVENWVDKATGQTLQVDENDLWMCAQARERNLVLVTTDERMKRISNADQMVRIQVIEDPDSPALAE